LNFFERLAIRILKAGAYYNSNYDVDLYHTLRKKASEETIDYINKNMPHALCFPTGKEPLLEYAISKIENEGDVLEFGVLTGHSINYIANKLQSKKIHGFDSFEGLPEDWTGNFIPQYGLSQKAKLPNVKDNVILHKGWFDDTIPEFKKQNNNEIAFLHVDCDIYSSTKTIFSELGDRIKKGTIIVFDEYFNYRNWQEHEFKAFQEYVMGKNIKYDYLAFNADGACCVKIL